MAAAQGSIRRYLCLGFAWSLIALCGWVGLPIAVYAQQQVSDSNATTEIKPALPKRGRDNNYTSQEMAAYLIALAEGPVPTREALEKKLGFEFILGRKGREDTAFFGSAGKPFTEQIPEGWTFGNVQYFEGVDGSVLLGMQFVALGFDKYTLCVPTTSVTKELLARGWTRRIRDRSGTTEVAYLTQIGGVQRTLDMLPDSLDEGRCMQRFGIFYTKVSNANGASK